MVKQKTHILVYIRELYDYYIYKIDQTKHLRDIKHHSDIYVISFPDGTYRRRIERSAG